VEKTEKTGEYEEDDNGQAYMIMFTQFMMGLTEEFREYSSRPDINLLRDGSGFTVAPIYVTIEELTSPSSQPRLKKL
jgi:hypothetical protein